MTQQQFVYRCYGLWLGFDEPVAELAGLEDFSSDVTPVPVRFDAPRLPSALQDGRTAGVERRGSGFAFINPEVGDFHFAPEAGLLVTPVPGASAADVRLFTLGSGIALILMSRSILPLHANAIALDGEVIAFCGPSGTGKSTMAAWHARQGATVLCDDVCALEFPAASASAGPPVVHPGPVRMKLVDDAVEWLGLDPGSLPKVAQGIDKRQVFIPRIRGSQPLPLAAVFILSKESSPDLHPTRLTPVEALSALLENTYRPGFYRRLDMMDWLVPQLARLLSTVPLYRANRSLLLERLPVEAEALVAFWRENRGNDH
jgi:hypothetical protein